MILFNVIKPDMLINKKTLEYYFASLSKIDKFSLKELYIVEDWILLSKLLYEIEIIKYEKEQEKRERRKELITTIKGYDLCYPEHYAVLVTFTLNSEITDALETMCKLKKEIRKKFVYETDKHYLKYLDQNLDFSNRLFDIEIENISVEHKVIPYSIDFNHPEYYMIYFNCLHCCDPIIENVQKESQIIANAQIIREKNILKRL